MLTATRLSGPAPLAVLFDATSTSTTLSTLPYHQLTYAFDFGDTGAGNWPITNLPRNLQTGGPLAAHVFDQPGTYLVTMRASSGLTSSVATITISVSNPALHWPGTDTIVVSTGGNFAGAPSGAEQRTSLPASYAGKRVLLRRGETFSGISLPGTADDVLIGAFGTGNKPVIGSLYLGGNGSVAQWPDEVTAMDLDITAGFMVGVTGSRILLYRCDVDTPSSAESQVDIGTAFGFYVQNGSLPASAYSWPREVFLVENRIEGDTNGDGHPNITVMGNFMKSAVLGNVINKATEHSLRMWVANRAVIAHNDIGGEHHAAPPPGIRHAIKIHSAGTSPYADNVGTSGLGISTRHLIIANNRIGSALYPGSWLIGIGPQNIDLGTVEPVIDLIYENNSHTRGPFTSQDFHTAALRCTTRGNTAVNGTFNGDVVSVSEWRGDPAMVPYLGSYFGQLQ